MFLSGRNGSALIARRFWPPVALGVVVSSSESKVGEDEPSISPLRSQKLVVSTADLEDFFRPEVRFSEAFGGFGVVVGFTPVDDRGLAA